MPITDTTNPETTLHFRPMVADGNTINYRFYPSIVRTGHIGNIRVLIGPRNDPFATFTEFIEYLLRFRFICMNDRREINITDNNTIVYLFRFLNQFVNTFNLETLGFTDTILQNIYRFLYPNLRNYTNQIRAHRYQFAILNQIYTETFDRDSDNVDRQINNILKLMYFIINGFDHIVIVDRVIQENTNENTYENINIGQLFLMHNYRTGQAFILFHVATDGNVYGNLTIPGNEALQTRLREAVGTDPFTLNNIHAGIIGGGRLGMLYQRCAAMRF